ncbi:MAG: S8 family serine peptidase [Flavisolibacter sp.]|nr:S8 family serine peptidase [Flavisolibacter sp.]
MKKIYLFLSVVSFVILTGCMKEVKEDTASNQINQASTSDEIFMGQVHANTNSAARSHVPNEILVKFKEGMTDDVKDKALKKIGGKIKEKVLTKAMERKGDNDGFFVVDTPLDVLEAIAKIKGMEIEYAEPNYEYTYGATSNDPYFTNGSLWGMSANGWGIKAATAWGNNYTGSSSVMIGIIDEGVMYNHTDLSGNVKNPVEFNGSAGVDDDENGFVDDIYGWDFVSNNNSVYDGTSDDHATHVAGTIGAKGGNGTGVAGVCWNITMVSAKFLGSSGGTTANAVKAVDYITNLKLKNGYNIVATNNSWGGGGYSQALYDAISRANDANILFIAAAGNGGSDGIGDNNDVTPNYPSNYQLPNVIAVASITSSGSRSSFSNYGKTTVHLGAPGSGIYSTVPGRKNTSTYSSYSGTSMATPHVTGAAALYASMHPNATAADIKTAILNNVTPNPNLSNTITGGVLNVSGF